MKEYNNTNHIFTSIKQAMHEPRQSKYAKKMMESINKHIEQKLYVNVPVSEQSPLIQESSTLSSNQSPDKIMESTRNYIKVIESEYEQLSDNLTVDSGVITFKEESVEKPQNKKRISFSPEHDRVVEIVGHDQQPKYYDIHPQRFLTQIFETPKPQKPEYKFVHKSTPTHKTEQLTKDVLQSANLIKDHYSKPEYTFDMSDVESNFVRSPSGRSADDKFVVNLFESRQSKRWKRKGVHFPDGDSRIQSLIDHESQETEKQEPDSQKTSYSDPWQEHLLDDNEMFLKLKKERDMECVKMVQASNVLKVIRKNPHKEWSDELLAEKILLGTDEKYALLINKIRDLGYAEVITPKPCHKATVTLSNFEFFLQPVEYKPSKYTNFYIFTLSHGTELLMSKVMLPRNNKIAFQEKFTFANLNSDFNIRVKIFKIKLKTSGRTQCSFLGKKTKNFCPMSKIYYENVNTYEMQESSVLRTSFNCCGEYVLTKNHIGGSHFTLSQISRDSQLEPEVNYSFQVDSLNIFSKLKGFLTLAMPSKQNEVLFRERKWCVLDGTILSIFNYPSEEEFGYPIFSINLQYCLIPPQMNFKNGSNKRTFLLKAGRPSVFDDVNDVALKKKSNFVVEKYFFIADNYADFFMWTSELQSTLNCLEDWQRLVFLDDYY